MKVVENEHEFGYTERRTYDDAGKLIEIRKIYPEGHAPLNLSPLKRLPGSGGGHDG